MVNDNIPIVDVGQFKQIARRQYEEGDRRPIFGLGKGGIGKSESVRDLAAEMGVGHIDIRLLTYSEVDLKGIPYPNTDHTKSIWLQNDVLPNPARDGEAGLLVLDEITSVARSVRTAAYQLLNERCLGEYRLPDGWMVICLGNGEEDGGDFQGMEGNFVNRCSVFRVTPSADAWKAWAAAHGVHELVLAYISWRPDELHTYSPDSETELAFASPRSWTAVSDILNRYGYSEEDALTRLRVQSNVGARTGEQFWAFCKYKDETVRPEDILSGAVTAPPAKSGEILYITLHSLIARLHALIGEDLAAHGEMQPGTQRACACAVGWILALPGMELQVMGMKDLVARHRDEIAQLLISDEFDQACPAFSAFARENASIFR